MPPRPTHGPDPLDQEFLDSRIVGQSAPMRRLKELLPRVAKSRSSVLIHASICPRATRSLKSANTSVT